MVTQVWQSSDGSIHSSYNSAEKHEKDMEINAEVDPIKKLAIYLHDKFCHGNHVDACGWFYEKDKNKWTQYAHDKWWFTAREIVIKCEELSVLK